MRLDQFKMALLAEQALMADLQLEEMQISDEALLDDEIEALLEEEGL